MTSAAALPAAVFAVKGDARQVRRFGNRHKSCAEVSAVTFNSRSEIVDDNGNPAGRAFSLPA